MSDRTPETVVDVLAQRIEATPDADAIYGRRGESWYTLSWRDVGDRARRIACGLLALGQEPGKRVAILAMTRPEWLLVDLGILSAAGATTTIYSSNTPEECAYILSDSGSVFCFAENHEQLAKLAEQRENLPELKKVVLIDGEPADGDDWVLSLDDLERLGESWDSENPGRADEVARAIGKDDLATLIYTSGTTGKPKGVMLSHDNWVYEGNATAEVALLSQSDKQYLFLPLAHSFAKVLEVALIRTGCATAIDGDIDRLIQNLPTVQPTVMAAVPRVFEKVYNKVVANAKDAGGLKYKIFLWAVDVGKRVSALRQAGKEPTGLLKIKHRIADKLVFSKLKARFGGKIRFFVSGGAPLARDIAEFFHAADILVLEGYGLTETSAATFINRPTNYKFGTVGLPMPGTEVRIAEDGEILIRGRGVMGGYYNLPEATAEALGEGGWLHTGDIGEVDDDGFLRITDRKKDLIVTAGGKNIAPQHVENLIKVRSSYVSQVVMLGDRRPYCVAIVTLNEETVGTWAAEKGLSASGHAELSRLPEVKELVWNDIEAVNADLARYETIKKIFIPELDFSIETGELTPKMSIKRKVVEKKYAADIEAFYQDTVASI